MNRKIISGTPVKILAFIATVFILISQFISTFIIQFDIFFLTFFEFLSFLFLDLYIFIFYKKFKASILIPAIFGCIAFIQFFYIFNYFLCYGLYGENILQLIINLILFTLFIAACINSYRDFKYKFITPTALISAILIRIFYFIKYITDSSLREIEVYSLLFQFSILLFYITLLLFLMKNKVKVKLETQNPDKLPAETALPLLKEQFEYGMYSEEDYNKKRAEIISKV